LLPANIKDFVLTTDLQTVVSAFQELGFIYVTLDLEGYRSGKLNQVLNYSTMIPSN
jgi:pyridinium-3,5-biscarboxylic acid mononucleotide sulfurtransferase